MRKKFGNKNNNITITIAAYHAVTLAWTQKHVL